MKRKFTRTLYVMALVYTAILLFLGFLAGMYYNNYLYNELREDLDLLSESSSTTQALLSMSAEKFCEAFPYMMPYVEENTWRLGEKIEYLEESKEVPKSLKMRYFDLEFRDMYLVEKAKDLCHINATIILYFYTNSKEKKCANCDAEGAQLTFARKELIDKGVNLKVYVFDGELGHPLVELEKRKYNITSYPTIVIIKGNSPLVMRGFTSKESIVNAVLSPKPSLS